MQYLVIKNDKPNTLEWWLCAEELAKAFAPLLRMTVTRAWDAVYQVPRYYSSIRNDNQIWVSVESISKIFEILDKRPTAKSPEYIAARDSLLQLCEDVKRWKSNGFRQTADMIYNYKIINT